MDRGGGGGEWGRGCGRCMRRKVYVGMGSHFGRFVSNKILVYVWKIGGGWFTSSKVWGIQIDKRKKKCIIYNNKMTAVVYTSMRVMFHVHE